jgi:hypothetical protein
MIFLSLNRVTATSCLGPRNAFLTEAFDSFVWTPSIGMPRDLMIFAAFAGMGSLFEKTDVRTPGQLVRIALEKRDQGWI